MPFSMLTAVVAESRPEPKRGSFKTPLFLLVGLVAQSVEQPRKPSGLVPDSSPGWGRRLNLRVGSSVGRAAPKAFGVGPGFESQPTHHLSRKWPGLISYEARAAGTTSVRAQICSGAKPNTDGAIHTPQSASAETWRSSRRLNCRP